MEAYYKGGQGPPRAVAPPKKKKKKKCNTIRRIRKSHVTEKEHLGIKGKHNIQVHVCICYTVTFSDSRCE